MYGLGDLVSNPAALKALKDYSKDAAKNAGQQLHAQLILSVRGEEATPRKAAKLPLSLEEFTWKIMDGWHRRGLGSHSGIDYQCRLAIMVSTVLSNVLV